MLADRTQAAAARVVALDHAALMEAHLGQDPRRGRVLQEAVGLQAGEAKRPGMLDQGGRRLGGVALAPVGPPEGIAELGNRAGATAPPRRL